MDNEPVTAYRRHHDKKAKWYDEESMLSNGLAGAGGLASLLALYEGDLPASAGFGIAGLINGYYGYRDRNRAADHRTKGRAVEDLIMRSRRNALMPQDQATGADVPPWYIEP